MRWGWPFSLDSAIQGASHWFPICCFVRRCPGRAVEGANRYPMAANTSVRRRTGTVDISKAVNHRESAFLAPGRHDRSTIRLEVYFFLATRANNIAGRWAINDRLKSLPPGLVRLPFPLWTTRQTPRVPSDPHRSSTIDVPQNQPRSAKEALELAPTAQRHGVPGRPEPLAGVRSRSRVRFTLIISHAYSPNPQLLPQIGDK